MSHRSLRRAMPSINPWSREGRAESARIAERLHPTTKVPTPADLAGMGTIQLNAERMRRGLSFTFKQKQPTKNEVKESLLAYRPDPSRVVGASGHTITLGNGIDPKTVAWPPASGGQLARYVERPQAKESAASAEARALRTTSRESRDAHHRISAEFQVGCHAPVASTAAPLAPPPPPPPPLTPPLPTLPPLTRPTPPSTRRSIRRFTAELASSRSASTTTTTAWFFSRP